LTLGESDFTVALFKLGGFMTNSEEDKSNETSFDQELKAMEVVAKAIQSLNPDAQKRVLQWAAARFIISGIAMENPRKIIGGMNIKNLGLANDSFTTVDAQQSAGAYPDIASLFDAANPKTNNNKTLVGGYWAQE
jgi:hypothetical protein